MSLLTGPSRSTQAYFWLFVVVVLTANALLAGPLVALHGAPVLEWPIAFDLLLLLPGVYLWVYRKRGRQAVIGGLALFGSSVFIGSLILPAGSQQIWPWLVQLRYVLLAVVLATQVALIVMMLREVLRAQATRNLELAVDEVLTRRLGAQRVFWRGIRGYARAHFGRAVVTSDVQSAMEGAAGRPLTQFFEQWVYAVPQKAAAELPHRPMSPPRSQH